MNNDADTEILPLFLQAIIIIMAPLLLGGILSTPFTLLQLILEGESTTVSVKDRVPNIVRSEVGAVFIDGYTVILDGYDKRIQTRDRGIEPGDIVTLYGVPNTSNYMLIRGDINAWYVLYNGIGIIGTVLCVFVYIFYLSMFVANIVKCIKYFSVYFSNFMGDCRVSLVHAGLYLGRNKNAKSKTLLLENLDRMLVSAIDILILITIYIFVLVILILSMRFAAPNFVSLSFGIQFLSAWVIGLNAILLLIPIPNVIFDFSKKIRSEQNLILGIAAKVLTCLVLVKGVFNSYTGIDENRGDIQTVFDAILFVFKSFLGLS